jgi:hypothetical protein
VGLGKRLAVAPARRVAIGRDRRQIANQGVGQKARIAPNLWGLAEHGGPEGLDLKSLTVVKVWHQISRKKPTSSGEEGEWLQRLRSLTNLSGPG